MIHKNRGNRRKINYSKAMSKKHISIQLYGDRGWYECDGKYIKGKIHCSCDMCQAKTYGKKNWYRGYRRIDTHKNWKVSDLRRVESLNDKLSEYQMAA